MWHFNLKNQRSKSPTIYMHKPMFSFLFYTAHLVQVCGSEYEFVNARKGYFHPYFSVALANLRKINMAVFKIVIYPCHWILICNSAILQGSKLLDTRKKVRCSKYIHLFFNRSIDMVSDPFLFTLSMVDTGLLLFLLVYFVSFLIHTGNDYVEINNFYIWVIQVAC